MCDIALVTHIYIHIIANWQIFLAVIQTRNKATIETQWPFWHGKILTETLRDVQNCSAKAKIAGSDEYDSMSFACHAAPIMFMLTSYLAFVFSL